MWHVFLMRSVVLLGSFLGPANADETGAIRWTTALEEATPCVAESEPDTKRAISCYEPAITACVSKRFDQYQACLEDAVKELRILFETYNLRDLDPELAAQNAPERCRTFVDESKPAGMSDAEFLALCEFTALIRQVFTAHMHSVWNGTPQQD
ncbi:MAG: hypothetical protein AAGI03_17400 [Pseudomonadota bacterium]